MNLILAFLLAWVTTITGVMLGGFLVFKTKRDPQDSLFAPTPKGEAFNLPDEFAGGLDDTRPRSDLPDAVADANSRFVDVFASNLARKAEKQAEAGKQRVESGKEA